MACEAATFGSPVILGGVVQSVEANLVTGYNNSVYVFRWSQPNVEVVNASFCNVTVQYTHPGENDRIFVEAWLPLPDKWNGMLQALGGGGWTAGRFYLTYQGMAGAMYDGYATVTTDAGVPSGNPLDWGLVSDGNTNVYALQTFGSMALGEEAAISKQLIASYYGHGPTYSYWNGCSQGGRQGLMIAQRFPDAYDGIIAAAPAIYFDRLVQSSGWPAFYMQQTKQYPYPCELNELTALAVTKCDALDGVEDGVIADTAACRAVFDPFAYVGSPVNCSDNESITSISYAAAAVANATWSGPWTSRGEFIYAGLSIGHPLGTSSQITCANGTCTYPTEGASQLGATQLVDLLFVSRNESAVKADYSWQEYDAVWRSFGQQYASLIRTDDADLRPFRDVGGKLMTFHGL
ncbi:hypothetical protein HK405_013157, partial [Cladochytrium tenue]